MSVLALIQARVNSSRLPRKSLAIIGARASVFHVWKRAEMAVGRPAAGPFVCVPWDDSADFRAVLPGWGATVRTGLRGTAEYDVLTRFAKTVDAIEFTASPDIIVRLTADCPFVDPEGIRAVAQAVESGADYARLHPVPNGLDAEALTVDLLLRAHREATDSADREHVTPWIQRNARSPVDVPMFAHLPRYRWTLDTAEDLAWFREVATEIDCTPPHPTVPELLALLERRPDLARLDGPLPVAVANEAVRILRCCPPSASDGAPLFFVTEDEEIDRG